MAIALVLVGAPGSGKTAVGLQLATLSGLAFSDVDDAIEHAAGMSTAEALITAGEAQFRHWEAQSLRTVLSQDHGIVAVGAGALKDPAARAALACLPVAWLRVGASTVVKRKGMDGPRSAALLPPRAAVADQLQQYEPWFSEVATWDVDAEAPLQDVVARLADVLRSDLGQE